MVGVLKTGIILRAKEILFNMLLSWASVIDCNRISFHDFLVSISSS